MVCFFFVYNAQNNDICLLKQNIPVVQTEAVMCFQMFNLLFAETDGGSNPQVTDNGPFILVAVSIIIIFIIVITACNII